MSPSALTGPSRRSAPARYSPPAWKPTPGSTRTPARRSIAPTHWRCSRASGQHRRHMRAQHSIRYVTQRAEWSCEASCDSSTSSDALLAQGLLPRENALGQFWSAVLLAEVAEPPLPRSPHAVGAFYPPLGAVPLSPGDHRSYVSRHVANLWI